MAYSKTVGDGDQCVLKELSLLRKRDMFEWTKDSTINFGTLINNLT